VGAASEDAGDVECVTVACLQSMYRTLDVAARFLARTKIYFFSFSFRDLRSALLQQLCFSTKIDGLDPKCLESTR